MTPEELFRHARAEIERIGAGTCTVNANEVAPDHFESRYIVVTCLPESYRLVWDGKEAWLALEWSPVSAPNNKPAWEDVALWRYPRNSRTTERANQILRELAAEFTVCLSQASANCCVSGRSSYPGD